MSATPNWLEPKVVIPSVIALVAICALVAVLLVGGGSDGSTGSASPAGAAAVTSTTQQGTVPSEATEEPTTATVPNSGPYTTPTMPVVVQVPEEDGTPVTDGVIDGQAVTVRAEPEADSLLFGVEARLCRGDRAVVTDGDFAPSLGGMCIDKPLSAVSDSKVSVVGQEPYGSLDVTFRVGVGSTTFMTQYDGSTTISCGPASPCQIVLKLQYPKGFGFKGIPVSYR
jgi:hypothetical protein